MKLINFSILYKPFAIFEEMVVQQAHRLSAIAPARLPGKSHGFSYRLGIFGNLVAKPRHGS
jgi:hypothetical protein